VEYLLRLELEKNGTEIFSGKIGTNMQYTFDKDLNVYISNFNLTATRDNLVTHNIKGLIAESA
jgi:hypothetical protein